MAKTVLDPRTVKERIDKVIANVCKARYAAWCKNLPPYAAGFEYQDEGLPCTAILYYVKGEQVAAELSEWTELPNFRILVYTADGSQHEMWHGQAATQVHAGFAQRYPRTHYEVWRRNRGSFFWSFGHAGV